MGSGRSMPGEERFNIKETLVSAAGIAVTNGRESALPDGEPVGTTL
jgi:hypothetical protein